MFKNIIVDLLFNPYGVIDKKKYLGACIILICIAYTAQSSIPLIISIISNILIGRFYSRELVNSISNYHRLFYYPSFIPYSFICFYCSFALGLKRARSINIRPSLGLLAGFLTFLFLTTLSRLDLIILIFVILPKMEILDTLIFPPKLTIIVTDIVLLLGFIQILIFSVLGKSEKTNQKKKMNQLNYVFYIGKLLIIFCPVILILIRLIALNFLEVIDLSNPVLIIFISIMSILLMLFFYFYIRGMVRRIDNAGYRKGLFLLIYFLFPVFILLIIIIFMYNLMNIGNIKLISPLQFLLYVTYSLFIAFNFIPIILPEHKSANLA